VIGGRQGNEPHRAPRWAAVSSRARVTVMVLAGAVAGVVIGVLSGQWAYAALGGWDVAALVFTVWVWTLFVRSDSRVTGEHARRDDPGVAAADVIVLGAAVASLASIGYVLVQASSAKGSTQDLLAGLGVVSVALSWFAVHTLFSLRYAKLYYSGHPGGVNFNQESPPRYLDFAYLGFTIGMTFQVSDTDLQTPTIRATALRHALLSYLFGAVTLAATINLVSQLASKG
jgi:uncharacterized membrane protein